MSTPVQTRRVWGRHTRVYWHGEEPDITRQGVVLGRTDPNDGRALVQWDGTTRAEAQWEERTALARCAEPCQCVYCVDVRKQAKAAKGAPPEHICGWVLSSGRAIKPSECAACVLDQAGKS